MKKTRAAAKGSPIPVPTAASLASVGGAFVVLVELLTGQSEGGVVVGVAAV